MKCISALMRTLRLKSFLLVPLSITICKIDTSYSCLKIALNAGRRVFKYRLLYIGEEL